MCGARASLTQNARQLDCVCTCACLPTLRHRSFRFPTEPKDSNLLDAHVGLGTMANYRAYHIGPDGRIRSGVDLECADDAEAIEAAGKLVGEFAVELWHDKRMVARLEAPPTRAP